jgi:hypothetical protein
MSVLGSNKRLSQCEMCGALMGMPTSSGVCSDCWDKDEDMYQKVKSNMKFGEKLLPEELSAKTGVDIKHIQRWAAQGRFG